MKASPVFSLLRRLGILILALALPLPLALMACSPQPPTPAEPPEELPPEDQPPEDQPPEDQSIPNAVKDPVLPTAPYRPATLLLSKISGGSLGMTGACLQGIVAASDAPEHILFTTGNYERYLPYIEEQGVTVSKYNEDGQAWSLAMLLARFSPYLKGYILCAEDLDSESASVAVSLAGLLSAVAVTPEYEDMAKRAGLTQVLDVTDKDDAWLRSSEYFGRLRTDLAVEQPVSMAPRLIDYAVMTNSYCYFYNGKVAAEHTAKFEFLEEGATVIGWNNTLGEYDTVRSLSGLSVQLIPADHANNLSTLSAFSLPAISQELEEPTGEAENKHTVCFILSDGDNLQWFVNDYAADRWYGSPYRGDFPMGWGVPGCAADIAGPMLQYYYDNAEEEDEFLLQLSGIGYTFPSRWEESAREAMAARLAGAMARMDLKYLEILDDKGFRSEYLQAFAAQDAIEGIFYIDYSNYAGEKGQLLFVEDTPVVSARYRIWSGLKDGAIQAVADGLNKGSTDPTSADGYSFVIVHAWSGINEEGELVGTGDSIEAVAQVIDLLGDTVEVVGMDEFMARIKNNVEH